MLLHKRNRDHWAKVARAMSRRHNIDVVMGSFTPMTDGRTIYLPADPSKLPGHNQESLHGFLDHETMHIIMEDEAERLGQRSPLSLCKFALTRGKEYKFMWNVYEDIRGERFVSNLWPGVAENLLKINQESAAVAGTRGKPDFWIELGCAIINASYGFSTDWCSPAVTLCLCEVEDLIQRSIEPGLTPQGAYDLAVETIERVKKMFDDAEDQAAKEEEEKEKAKGKGGKGKPVDGEVDEDGEGEEGEEGDAEIDAAMDIMIEECRDEMPPEDAAMLRERAKEAAAGPSKTDLIRESDEAKNIERAARKEAKTARRSTAHVDVLKHDRLAEVRVGKGDAAAVAEVKREVNSQIGSMRRRLSTFLNARNQTHFVGDQDEGELDSSALADIRFGSRRVFEKRTKVRGQLDTAVTLLVDLSGSMGMVDNRRNAAYYAQRATIALAETLNSINVPFEVLGFHNDSRCWGTIDRHKAQGYTRWLSMEMFNFKSFNEPLQRCRPRFAHMSGRCQNADGDCLRFAAERILKRPEGRRLMIVISDGEPCGAGDYGTQNYDLGEAIRECNEAGVDTVGIGAGFAGVREYYCPENGSECIVVDDITQLATQVVKLLRKRFTATLRGAA